MILPGGGSLHVTDGLINCLVDSAGQLPLPQLREVATPNPPQSLGLSLISECMREGVDVVGVRQAVGEVIEARTTSLPPSFGRCVAGQVAKLTGFQLADLFAAESQAGLGAGARFGANLAAQCLVEHPDEMRALLVFGMRQGLARARVSPAYGRCMIEGVKGLRRPELDRLVRMAASGDAVSVQLAGDELRRQLAPSCTARIGSPPQAA
jgi:hypothetical protein